MNKTKHIIIEFRNESDLSLLSQVLKEEGAGWVTELIRGDSTLEFCTTNSSWVVDTVRLLQLKDLERFEVDGRSYLMS